MLCCWHWQCPRAAQGLTASQACSRASQRSRLTSSVALRDFLAHSARTAARVSSQGMYRSTASCCSACSSSRCSGRIVCGAAHHKLRANIIRTSAQP